MNNSSVDSYLRDGCGRCDKYRTPACKVHRWTRVLEALRELLRGTELVETMKWGSPCYMLDERNVVMLVSFVDRCALQFFKGAALRDEAGVLTSPGPNSRYVRLLEFRSPEDLVARRLYAKRFLDEAIALERAGTKIETPREEDPLPDELAQRLRADPTLQRAFAALTKGRQRSHILYIAGAKQSETRARRVVRCEAEIRAGRGFNER